MGRYQFFCKIDTISKKINLVSVYIVDTADNVGLYNNLNEFHTANFRRFVFTARCTIVQSAVLRLHVVCHLSVTLPDQEHIRGNLGN